MTSPAISIHKMPLPIAKASRRPAARVAGLDRGLVARASCKQSGKTTRPLFMGGNGKPKRQVDIRSCVVHPKAVEKPDTTSAQKRVRLVRDKSRDEGNVVWV